jgi:ABC-type ATPase with predicted acetyltransferase domain
MWLDNSGSLKFVEWNGISGSSDGAYVYGAIANMNEYLNANPSEKVFYFKCKNCGRKILVNIEKLDVLELSCRSCGSSEMEKLCE